MQIDQLIEGLFHADLFLAVSVALLSVAIFCIQIFAAVVGFRFLVFVWHWLGFQEVRLTERSLKQNGSWTVAQRPQLGPLQVSQSAHWRAILTAAYVLVFGSLLVAAFFVFNQPAGWLVLFVVVAVLLFLLAMILLN